MAFREVFTGHDGQSRAGKMYRLLTKSENEANIQPS